MILSKKLDWIKKSQKTYDEKHAKINKLKYFCIAQPHNSQTVTRFSFNDNFHPSDELTHVIELNPFNYSCQNKNLLEPREK